MADRARRYEQGLREREGVTELARRFAAQHGDRVLRGVAAGLRLPVERLGEIDAPTAKLLGSYEQEIHPALGQAVAAGVERFIDLGCADGYYAVGIARAARLPVEAFDVSRSARSLTAAVAELNGVGELVRLHGAVRPAALERLELDRCLLLCDIDGPERRLFTRRLVRRLRTAHVVVECHTAAHPDVVRVLSARFAPTHAVRVAHATRRLPSRYQELCAFPDPAERTHAVDELRYRVDGRQWLVAAPRHPAGGR
jgi:SAM-dependent methyltransferase